MVGDYFFVSKTAYGNGRGPQAGDIAVFKYPADTRIDYVKRVVGLPGDKVQICDIVLELRKVTDGFQKSPPQPHPIAPEPWRAAVTASSPPPIALTPAVDRLSPVKSALESAKLQQKAEAVPKKNHVAPSADNSRELLSARELSSARPVKPAQSGGQTAAQSRGQSAGNLPLDIHILLDVSGSMAGEPLQAALAGLHSVVTELTDDGSEFLLSLITYGPTARAEFMQVRASDVRLGTFKASGFSALGQALNLLATNVVKDALQKNTRKPLVFVIGDCQGTDEPHTQLAALRADTCALFLCVLGRHTPDASLLNACEDAACAAKPSDFSALFDWIKSIIIQRLTADAPPIAVSAPLQTLPRQARRAAR